MDPVEFRQNLLLEIRDLNNLISQKENLKSSFLSKLEHLKTEFQAKEKNIGIQMMAMELYNFLASGSAGLAKRSATLVLKEKRKEIIVLENKIADIIKDLRLLEKKKYSTQGYLNQIDAKLATQFLRDNKKQSASFEKNHSISKKVLKKIFNENKIPDLHRIFGYFKVEGEVFLIKQLNTHIDPDTNEHVKVDTNEQVTPDTNEQIKILGDLHKMNQEEDSYILAIAICYGVAHLQNILINRVGLDPNNPKHLEVINNMTYYSGHPDQKPDPDLEEHFGHIPGYKDVCYVVIKNFVPKNFIDFEGKISFHFNVMSSTKNYYSSQLQEEIIPKELANKCSASHVKKLILTPGCGEWVLDTKLQYKIQNVYDENNQAAKGDQANKGDKGNKANNGDQENNENQTDNDDKAEKGGQVDNDDKAEKGGQVDNENQTDNEDQSEKKVLILLNYHNFSKYNHIDFIEGEGEGSNSSEDTGDHDFVIPNGKPNVILSLDQAQNTFSNLEEICIVVCWFTNDSSSDNVIASLSNITQKQEMVFPAVEYKSLKDVYHSEEWKVADQVRDTAVEMIKVNNSPIYGGTMSDNSITNLFKELLRRNLTISFNFLLLVMHPNKHWRGHIETSGDMIEAKFFFRGYKKMKKGHKKLKNDDDRNEINQGDDYNEEYNLNESQDASQGREEDQDEDQCSENDDELRMRNKNFFSEDEEMGEVIFSDEYINIKLSSIEYSYGGYGYAVIHYACIMKDFLINNPNAKVGIFVIGSELKGLTISIHVVNELKILAAKVQNIFSFLPKHLRPKITYGCDWTECKNQDLHSLYESKYIDCIGMSAYFNVTNNIASNTQVTTDLILETLLKNIQSTDHPFNILMQLSIRFNKPMLFTECNCASLNVSTNNPNIFLDSKSYDGINPPTNSNLSRDYEIQSTYIKAMSKFLVIMEKMFKLEIDGAYFWTWDARGCAWIDVEYWSDKSLWPLGHYLNNKLPICVIKDILLSHITDILIFEPNKYHLEKINFFNVDDEIYGFKMRLGTSLIDLISSQMQIGFFDIELKNMQLSFIKPQIKENVCQVYTEELKKIAIYINQLKKFDETTTVNYEEGSDDLLLIDPILLHSLLNENDSYIIKPFGLHLSQSHTLFNESIPRIENLNKLECKSNVVKYNRNIKTTFNKIDTFEDATFTEVNELNDNLLEINLSGFAFSEEKIGLISRKILLNGIEESKLVIKFTCIATYMNFELKPSNKILVEIDQDKPEFDISQMKDIDLYDENANIVARTYQKFYILVRILSSSIIYKNGEVMYECTACIEDTKSEEQSESNLICRYQAQNIKSCTNLSAYNMTFVNDIRDLNKFIIYFNSLYTKDIHLDMTIDKEQLQTFLDPEENYFGIVKYKFIDDLKQSLFEGTLNHFISNNELKLRIDLKDHDIELLDQEAICVPPDQEAIYIPSVDNLLLIEYEEEKGKGEKEEKGKERNITKLVVSYGYSCLKKDIDGFFIEYQNLVLMHKEKILSTDDFLKANIVDLKHNQTRKIIINNNQNKSDLDLMFSIDGLDYKTLHCLPTRAPCLEILQTTLKQYSADLTEWIVFKSQKNNCNENPVDKSDNMEKACNKEDTEANKISSQERAGEEKPGGKEEGEEEVGEEKGERHEEEEGVGEEKGERHEEEEGVGEEKGEGREEKGERHEEEEPEHKRESEEFVKKERERHEEEEPEHKRESEEFVKKEREGREEEKSGGKEEGEEGVGEEKGEREEGAAKKEREGREGEERVGEEKPGDKEEGEEEKEGKGMSRDDSIVEDKKIDKEGEIICDEKSENHVTALQSDIFAQMEELIVQFFPFKHHDRSKFVFQDYFIYIALSEDLKKLLIDLFKQDNISKDLIFMKITYPYKDRRKSITITLKHLEQYLDQEGLKVRLEILACDIIEINFFMTNQLRLSTQIQMSYTIHTKSLEAEKICLNQFV